MTVYVQRYEQRYVGMALYKYRPKHLFVIIIMLLLVPLLH